MLQEVGTEELREMKLFHGTSSSVVDAICKGNFDWRLCGTHGTVFGQGRTSSSSPLICHGLGGDTVGK